MVVSDDAFRAGTNVEERLFRAASRNSIDLPALALQALALNGDILLHCRNAAMNGRSSTDKRFCTLFRSA